MCLRRLWACIVLDSTELGYCESGVDGYGLECTCAEDIAECEEIEARTISLFHSAAASKGLIWLGPSTEEEAAMIALGSNQQETSWRCLNEWHIFIASLYKIQHRLNCPLCKRTRMIKPGISRVRHETKGTCQLCGELQSVHIDTDLLAEHDYSPTWNFLSGCCEGSNQLRFEQSDEVVKSSIGLIEQTVNQLYIELNRLRSDRTPLVQRRNDLLSSEVQRDAFEVNEANRSIWQAEMHTKFPDAAIEAYNDYRAHFVGKDVQPRHAYLIWQQQRLVNWRQTELIQKAAVEALRSMRKVKTQLVRESKREAVRFYLRHTPELVSKASNQAEAAFARGDNAISLSTERCGAPQ